MRRRREPNGANVRAVSPDVGIVLIAHGSRRDEANAHLIAVAEQLRHRGYRRVFASFLELAEPDILTAGESCIASGARQVVLSPYFLSPGRHVTSDLENARRELARRHPHVDVRLAGPLGPHRMLEEVLLERIDQALGRPCDGETQED